MNIKKYIKDGIDCAVKFQDMQDANNAIEKGVKYSNFTIGTDTPCEERHFEFINKLLNRFDSIYYILNDGDGSGLANIDSSYRDRVIVVDEGSLVYAAKVDIFVPFQYDWKFNWLMKNNRAFVSESPFVKLTWYEQVSDSFSRISTDKNVANYYNRCQKLFGEKEPKTPKDIFYWANGDVLPHAEIEKMHESKAVGIEKVLKWIDWLMKYPRFRERQALISRETFLYQSEITEMDPAEARVESFLTALS